MNVETFFDIKDIFVNEVVGNFWVFTVLGLVIIFYVSSVNSLPDELSVLLGGLWLVFCFTINYSALQLWVMVVFAVGVFFYYTVSKKIHGG